MSSAGRPWGVRDCQMTHTPQRKILMSFPLTIVSAVSVFSSSRSAEIMPS